MEVYICIMRGGYISSVTIIDAEYAEHTIKQYRSSGLTVRTFRDREHYEEFCNKNYEIQKENMRLQREVMR